jgi:hypothetical protein
LMMVVVVSGRRPTVRGILTYVTLFDTERESGRGDVLRTDLRLSAGIILLLGRHILVCTSGETRGERLHKHETYRWTTCTWDGWPGCRQERPFTSGSAAVNESRPQRRLSPTFAREEAEGRRCCSNEASVREVRGSRGRGRGRKYQGRGGQRRKGRLHDKSRCHGENEGKEGERSRAQDDSDGKNSLRTLLLETLFQVSHRLQRNLG